MKPHKHAALIKAWADGAEIECWFGTYWEVRNYPSWSPNLNFRIKPPEDKVYFACYDPLDSSTNYAGCNQQLRLYIDEQNLKGVSTGQLKLTFDGTTGKIKSAEVL